MKTIPLENGKEYILGGAEIPEDLKVFKLFDDHIKVAENREDLDIIINKNEYLRDNLLHLISMKCLPYPHTVYKDVFNLSKYGKVRVKQKEGEWVVENIIDFPFLSDYSRQDQQFQLDTFEKKLNSSVKQSIEDSTDIILLLSDGKDSVPLALALNELGIKARCYTHALKNSNTHLFTEKLAKELGHDYKLIDENELDKLTLEHIWEFYNQLHLPTVDLSTIVFAYIYFFENNEGSVILDGSGNDLYMGNYVNLKKKITYFFRKLSIDPIERIKGGNLVNNMSYLFGIKENDIAISKEWKYFWKIYLNDISKFNLSDKRVLIWSKNFSDGELLNKLRTLNMSTDLNIRLPYLRNDFVNYVFNLPASERVYNGKHKVCLRKYLQYKLPKRSEYIETKRSFGVRYNKNIKSEAIGSQSGFWNTKNNVSNLKYYMVSAVLNRKF